MQTKAGTVIKKLLFKKNNKKIISIILIYFISKPYYISPEVLKGDYDESCDIWSAGISIFIILVKIN